MVLISKQIIFAVGCSIVALARAEPDEKLKIGHNLQAMLASADRFERLDSGEFGPKVGLTTYLFDDDNTLVYDLISINSKFGRVGAQIDYFADIFGSYQMPTFWLERQKTNWMIFNPNVFLEASAEGSLTLRLAVIELVIKTKVLAFRYTPFEYQLAFDLDSKSRYCQSLSYFWEVLDFNIMTEWNINECYFGLLSLFINPSKQPFLDLQECSWRRYRPQLPVFEFTLQN